MWQASKPMTVLPFPGPTDRKPVLTKDVIAKRGAMTAVLDILRNMLEARHFRRERPPDVASLDARMRRDIGLRTETDLPDFTHLRF